MVAEDTSLIITRVRLSRHPDAPASVSDADEAYAMKCEIATMQYVREKLPAISVPRVYSYEGPGSQLSTAARAVYMLLEGFYGNNFLPAPTQEHIIAQWTNVQAQLATLTHPRIGSITALSQSGEPIIDRLASAATEGLGDAGPFSTTAEYFSAVGQAAVKKLNADHGAGSESFARTGALVFCDIASSSSLFSDVGNLLALNHMDLGTHAILVDESFNFVAIISLLKTLLGK